jgi:tRNA A37 threonylcarbamoyladenosine dehydratase|tara:strand:- start:2462 stop:3205 length:744 start_codon:yes stop_codon:yes gene_type:complete
VNSPKIDIERRFGGIIRLFGETQFNQFQSSHICIVGIGGVGSWVAESMARHGIGKITLIDMDHVTESNINRQIHALDSTIGASKVKAMQERILDINPDCDVICIDEFLTEENISIYIKKNFSFVVDAIDQTKVKIALADYCLIEGLQFVMIGGAGGKKNPELVKLTDILKTFGDPLLTKIRQHFNKKVLNKIKRNFPVIFSSELIEKPSKGWANNSRNGLNCDGYGSSPNVTATFAFIATSYVLNKL